MIWPSQRLVWLVALTVVPACGLWPVVSPALAIGIIFAVATLAAWDALRMQNTLEQIRVVAPASAKWFKGREAELTLNVKTATAAGRRANLLISLALPPEIQAVSPSSSVAADGRAAIACIPNRRGPYLLTGCHVSCVSPLELWRGQKVMLIQTEIRVYPDLLSAPGGRMLVLQKGEGLRRQRLAGRGREVERLREYAPGDTFDEIYWKATARRGRPVVKVFQVERTQDVYAVIDSSRLGARNDALEHFVSAALLTGLAVERAGDNFGLVTFSHRVDHFVRASRGKGHFARCRDAVYHLQASRVSPDFEELFTFLQLQLRRRALLLFLTDLGDPLLAEAFARDARRLARKHLAVVSQIRDAETRPLFSGSLPEDAGAINLRLAGHLQWSTLAGLEKTLQRQGIGMAALRSSSAAGDLVSRYLEVKQRQLL